MNVSESSLIVKGYSPYIGVDDPFMQVCHYPFYLSGGELLINVKLPNPCTWHHHNHISSLSSSLTTSDTRVGNPIVTMGYLDRSIYNSSNHPSRAYYLPQGTKTRKKLIE